MNITDMFDEMLQTLGRYIPTAIAALVILVVGWILALAVRAGVRRLLGWVRVNERLASTRKEPGVDVESIVAKGVYYFMLLFVLIGVVNVLNLTLVSEPLQALITPFFAFIPKLVAGGIIALTAWILATLARTVITKVLSATKLDQKLSTSEDSPAASENIGTLIFWIVILLFLPAVLSALQVGGLLAPVEGLVADILAAVPNIIAATVIGLVGWFVAKLLRDIVTRLLTSTGADKLGAKLGLGEKTTLSGLAGILVQIFVFVPALVAALEALRIDAISTPATAMLNRLVDAVPNILAAAITLAVAFIVGRFVVNLLAKLLETVGFDTLPDKLGLREAISEDVVPSKIVAKVAFFFIILFGLMEAANQIEFGQIVGLISMFIEFGAQVLLGVAILLIGFWLAGAAHRTLTKFGGESSNFVANLARYTIIGLVLAMGLRAMGIADDIVNLAFGLTLGAVAIAVALSFGLGGRAAAGKQLDYWFKGLRKDRTKLDQ